MSILLQAEPLSQAPSCPEFQTPDSDSVDTALLSPPLTPMSERDIPFKPTESDNISLGMKKRHVDKSHSQRASLCRKHISSTDEITHGNKASAADPTCIPRVRSLPSLNYSLVEDSQNRSSPKKAGAVKDTITGQARRWTLPSKAHPTKGLTTLNSVVKLHTPKKKKKNYEISPALITLRRATLKPSRKTSLTFFPPPTFSRTKSGLVSSFLKSITGSEDHTSENIDFLTREIQRDGSDRSPKLIAGTPQPSPSAMAEPLLTEMLSNVSVTDTAMSCRRRCSTRYVSGASIYEVIWDENDSPSNTSDCSTPNIGVKDAKPQASPTTRRQSAAMDKLETQLFRAIAQSRRESYISQDDDSPPCKDSFQSFVSIKFSHLFNERSLYNLPRSKASRIFKKPDSASISTSEAVQQTFDDESLISPRDDIEFFPPLQSHGNTNNNSSPAERLLNQINRRVSVGAGRPSMGSMLGASSHIRRRSLRDDDDDRHKRKSSMYGSRRKSSGFVLSDAVVSEETTPLLHGTT